MMRFQPSRLSLLVHVALSSSLLTATGCGNDPPLTDEDTSQVGASDDEAKSDDDDERDEADTDDRGADEDDGGVAGPDEGAVDEGDDPHEPSAQCDVPAEEATLQEDQFARLQAVVVDQDGDPVPDITAQACALNLCLFGSTDDVGAVRFTESPPQAMRRPAFKYGDGLTFAQFARPLDAALTEHELGEQRTVAFPSLSGAELIGHGDNSSGGARLTVADDASIHFDILSFPEDDDHRFLAVEVPTEVWPDAVTLSGFDFESVWALGPLKTTFCPKAQLELDNTTGLEAGTEVEFLIHVTDTLQEWGVYGGWGRMSGGRVSDDGQKIVTDEDDGIYQLGVVAIRVAESVR